TTVNVPANMTANTRRVKTYTATAAIHTNSSTYVWSAINATLIGAAQVANGFATQDFQATPLNGTGRSSEIVTLLITEPNLAGDAVTQGSNLVITAPLEGSLGQGAGIGNDLNCNLSTVDNTCDGTGFQTDGAGTLAAWGANDFSQLARNSSTIPFTGTPVVMT